MSTEGIPFNCTIDSGGGCSLLTKGILQQLGKVELSPPDRTLMDASQNTIDLIGKANLPVMIHGTNGERLTQSVEFYVSENAKCLLSGRNVMKQFGTTTFDFDRNEIQLVEIWCNGLQMNGGQVKLLNDVDVPPCEKLVKAKWCKGNGLVTGDFIAATLAHQARMLRKQG